MARRRTSRPAGAKDTGHPEVARLEGVKLNECGFTGRQGLPCGKQRIRNKFYAKLPKALTEMTTLKAALLSFAMLSAIALCGFGIYAADASSDHAVFDGYGVGAANHQNH
ncbi:hypothetical protein M2281_000862 [Mesorhizobium soli]|jgi:hypothetical protein|uniref:hypothetical protein n=1 Tax=Pseudaminobacter soli (ex Li et al. 2025) TaxID=1295366 RepID=UPI0024736CE9|nr:hypothetical protein [Mesorhizobium soli]MDH6230290.1 hypothetical protein [Mesorhizobium soli]